MYFRLENCRNSPQQKNHWFASVDLHINGGFAYAYPEPALLLASSKFSSVMCWRSSLTGQLKFVIQNL